MSAVRKELGLSDADYAEWLDVSEHRCWICGHEESIEGRRLAVDHDHLTGAIRGLLCTSCNRRLGASRDPEWHARAAEYLIVANRAFGDACRTCGRLAISRPDRRDGDDGWRYVHRCCGRRWECSYTTKGTPSGWRHEGIPAPPRSRPPLTANEDAVGHPGAIEDAELFMRGVELLAARKHQS